MKTAIDGRSTGHNDVMGSAVTIRLVARDGVASAGHGTEHPGGPRDSQIRQAVPALSESAARERIRALVVEHFDFVWRCLRRFGLTAADADDAAQKVFLVLSRRLDSVIEGSERAFLYSTAVRVASDSRRAHLRRRECANDEVMLHARAKQAPPDEQLERARARVALDEIVAELADDVRDVFVLYELEELKTHEIADVLAIPVGTVASRLRRAREQFRAATRRYLARRAFSGAER